MKQLSACLFLFFIPILAMESDDDVLVKICALGDEQEKVVAIVPQNIAFACETIQTALEFEDDDTVFDWLFLGSYKFYVDPKFACPALLAKLKSCMEVVTNIPKDEVPSRIRALLANKQDLSSMLRASSYFEHNKLFEYCVAEWVDRDYLPDESDYFPQEVEGALANALLAKHSLHHKMKSIVAETVPVPIKMLKCKNRSAAWSCAIGRNRAALAAGCLDGSLDYWVKIGGAWRRKALAPAHNEAVGRVQFIENNTKLISSGNEAGIKIWDLETGTCIKSFGHEESNGFFFAYDEARGLLVIPTKQNEINGYNLRAEDAPIALHLDGHEKQINTLAFNPTSDMIASGGSDSTLALWDLNGHLLHYFDLCAEALSSNFNHKGTHIAVGMKQGALQIYDIENYCLAYEKRDAHIQNTSIWGCCFSMNDTLLVTGAEDRKIKVWAIPGLECLRVIEGDWSGILFFDQQIGTDTLLVAFSNGSIGLLDLLPLVHAMEKQHDLLKNGLKLALARFWVQASQATKKEPLVCTGENGKIFSSLSAAAQAQLIKNFNLAVPEGLLKTKLRENSLKKSKQDKTGRK